MPFPLLRQESAGEMIAEGYRLVTKARFACFPVLLGLHREIWVGEILYFDQTYI